MKPKFMVKLVLLWLFISSLGLEVYADVLDTWTTNQITADYFEFHHIVYGGGIYVAVAQQGDYGQIYSSKDGLNWTLRYSDYNSWGMNLGYANGRFYGAGGWANVHTSTDGTNWTSSQLPSSFAVTTGGNGPPVQSMTYGNGLYAIVGSTNNVGSILTSPDGVNWTYSKPGSAGRNRDGPINSVAYGASTFVAIGNNDGLVYTSSTGTSWPKSSLFGGSKISYANGLFFVPLNNKTNQLSVDGINWVQQPTGLTNLLGKINYANGIFMAQCGISKAQNFLATSIDGTNWMQYPKPLPNYWTSGYDLPDPDVSLATDGARLVCIGATNGVFPIYYSFIYTSDVLVETRMTNAPTPQVRLSGLIGRNYQIQSTDDLGASSNWKTNVTVKLTNTVFLWSDSTATNRSRFYSGVLQP